MSMDNVRLPSNEEIDAIAERVDELAAFIRNSGGCCCSLHASIWVSALSHCVGDIIRQHVPADVKGQVVENIQDELRRFVMATELQSPTVYRK